MSNDKPRDAFEAWWDSTFTGVPMSVAEWRVGWQAWQAAQQAQWLPIETAPSDMPFLGVLDCAGERTICTMRLAVAMQKNSVPDNGDFHRERVTHWMPLPPEPKK